MSRYHFTRVCVCTRASKMFVKCVHVYVRAHKPVGEYTLSPVALPCLDVDSRAKDKPTGSNSSIIKSVKLQDQNKKTVKPLSDFKLRYIFLYKQTHSICSNSQAQFTVKTLQHCHKTSTTRNSTGQATVGPPLDISSLKTRLNPFLLPK